MGEGEEGVEIAWPRPPDRHTGIRTMVVLIRVIALQITILAKGQ